MSIKQKITEDLKQAMKSGESNKRDVLRMVDSAIKNIEIEKGKREEGLNDEEIIEVLFRALKQRQDSISQYEKGGRPELAEKEKNEVEIISHYLPEQLDKEGVRDIVKETIEQMGAQKDQDFGRIMGASMGKLKGKADGNLVKEVVKEELEKV